MEEKFCQCCGMLMVGPEAVYGTNKDGSLSEDYCSYCYEKGEFTFQGTMEEMIDMCVPMMVEHNKIEEAEARTMMEQFLPNLKRWKESKE